MPDPNPVINPALGLGLYDAIIWATSVTPVTTIAAGLGFGAASLAVAAIVPVAWIGTNAYYDKLFEQQTAQAFAKRLHRENLMVVPTKAEKYRRKLQADLNTWVKAGGDYLTWALRNVYRSPKLKERAKSNYRTVYFKENNPGDQFRRLKAR